MEGGIVVGSWARLTDHQKEIIYDLPLPGHVITMAAFGVNQHVSLAALKQGKRPIVVTAGGWSIIPNSLKALYTRVHNAGGEIREFLCTANDFGSCWRNSITHTVAWLYHTFGENAKVTIIGTPIEWYSERSGYYHLLRQAGVYGIPVERLIINMENDSIDSTLSSWMMITLPPTEELIDRVREAIDGKDVISLHEIAQIIKVNPYTEDRIICSCMRTINTMLELVTDGELVWHKDLNPCLQALSGPEADEKGPVSRTI